MNTQNLLVALATVCAVAAPGFSARAASHGAQDALVVSASPLVFSLRGARPLTTLLASDRTGDERAYLVRQSSGGASWWSNYRDAYAALSSLDGNGDGWLSGTELKGLGVWRDRNQNGVADAGEVVPVASVGIEAIATRATSKAGDAPANPTGLFLKSGRTLPTYDWTTGARQS